MKIHREPATQTPTDILWREYLPRDTACVLPGDASVPLRGLKPGAELKDAFVGLFGTGAVGGNVLLALPKQGVRNILALDVDTFGAESVLTQPCLLEDAGKPKVFVLAERAHEINPGCHILAGFGAGQDLPLAAWRKLQVAVVAGDNLELLVAVTRMAMGLGIPLVQGAVFPSTWLSIVRAHDLRDPEHQSCPACTLSAPEWRNLRSRRGCDPTTARRQGIMPTLTLPVICTHTAQLVTAEVLKWLLGEEKLVLRGEELNYSLLSHRVLRTALPRNDKCRLSHRRWRQIDLAEAPSAISLALAADRLGEKFGPGHWKGLQVRSEIPWVSFVLCPACGRKNPVRRFARLGAQVGRCLCGEELLAGPMGKCAVVPHGDLEACWDAPLETLGLGATAALAMGTDSWTWFFFPCDPFDSLLEPGWPGLNEVKPRMGSGASKTQPRPPVKSHKRGAFHEE